MFLHWASRFCLALLLAGSLSGQVRYPGQYPPYPPGQSPIPIPRDPRIPDSGSQVPGVGKRETKTVHAGGIVNKVTARYFTIDAPQKKTITFQYSSSTRFLRDGKKIQAADLKTGDRVRIEAEEDSRGWLNAYQVTVEPPEQDQGAGNPSPDKTSPEAAKSDASKADANRPPAPGDQTRGEQPKQQGTGQEADPGAKQNQDVVRVYTNASKNPPPGIEDDSGPPVLRRGKPEPQAPTSRHAATTAATTPAAGRSTSPPPPPSPKPAPPLDPHEALIARARQATETFTEKLPNFVCQQVTTRYTSRLSGRSWDASDVLTANVVVEGNQESYRNITVDGRPTNKTMEQLGGAWSSGEFAALAYDLFIPETQARFTYRRDETQARLPASVYDYEVAQPNSAWEVAAPGARVKPAYKGTVWIEKENGRVLRIEMQAVGLPGDFPLDTAETTLEYDYVTLAGKRFLLPVRSENLSCQRGTPYCARNVIDFRNYHMYTGESTVTFGDPVKP